MESVDLSSKGVRVLLDAVEMFVPWKEVIQIYGWLLKTPVGDVVYLTFVHESGHALEVHNDMNGWERLLNTLADYVPAIVVDVPLKMGLLSENGEAVVFFAKESMSN